jgi:hypothetical protein
MWNLVIIIIIIITMTLLVSISSQYCVSDDCGAMHENTVKLSCKLDERYGRC